jgi:hypothetical protein
MNNAISCLRIVPGCILWLNELDLFEKIRNTDEKMYAKANFKTHLRTVFHFLSHFVYILHQSFRKVNKKSPYNCKTAELYADFVEKAAKELFQGGCHLA